MTRRGFASQGGSRRLRPNTTAHSTRRRNPPGRIFRTGKSPHAIELDPGCQIASKRPRHLSDNLTATVELAIRRASSSQPGALSNEKAPKAVGEIYGIRAAAPKLTCCPLSGRPARAHWWGSRPTIQWRSLILACTYGATSTRPRTIKREPKTRPAGIRIRCFIRSVCRNSSGVPPKTLCAATPP
jgi:hypothetical protein